MHTVGGKAVRAAMAGWSWQPRHCAQLSSEQVRNLSGAKGSGFHSPHVGTPIKGMALQSSPPKQPTTAMSLWHESAANSACGELGPYMARIAPALAEKKPPMIITTPAAM